MPENTKTKSLVSADDPYSKVRRKLLSSKSRLDVKDKISIVHSVLCDGEYYKDVAKRY